MVGTPGALLTFVVSFVACSAQWALSQETPADDFHDVKLTVLVYNYANISRETTDKAQGRAAVIFRDTGIRIQWMDSEDFKREFGNLPDRQEKQNSVDITLRLMPHSRTALTGGALGEALPCELGRDACIANVFLDRVNQKTDMERISIAEVLGHAMAHEMGHLLLGSHSHHSDGIMQAKWGKTALKRASKGDLLFTFGQSKSMRCNLLEHIGRQHPVFAE